MGGAPGRICLAQNSGQASRTGGTKWWTLGALSREKSGEQATQKTPTFNHFIQKYPKHGLLGWAHLGMCLVAEGMAEVRGNLGARFFEDGTGFQTSDTEGFASDPEGFTSDPEGFTSDPEGLTSDPEGFTSDPQGVCLRSPRGSPQTWRGSSQTP